MNLIHKYDLRFDDYECDICGVGPLEEVAEVVCSIPDPSRGGTHRQTRYQACLDCLKAGPASFPDRLREHARWVEERARETAKALRQFANAEWSSLPGRTYADIMREHEEERRRADVQRMTDQLAELRAHWPEYEFTVKPLQQK